MQGQPIRYQQRPQTSQNRQTNAAEKSDFKCNFCQVLFRTGLTRYRQTSFGSGYQSVWAMFKKRLGDLAQTL